MKPMKKRSIRRVDNSWKKPVITSGGVVIPKEAKNKLNELEKRLRENYATIEKMSLSDEYRLTNVVRNYLEEISGYIGPREKVRSVLKKLRNSYPLSTGTMLALISDVETEREAVDKIKGIIKGIPELHKRLVSKETPVKEKALIIDQIARKIEEKEGPVLVKELAKAVEELGVNDIEIKPLKESDPKTPEFWMRKIELEANPDIKRITEAEKEYVKPGGRIKDEIMYLRNTIEEYKNNEISEEELEEELQNLIDIGMQLLEGDREKFIEYLYKYDETEGKSVYNIIVRAMGVEKMPTNRDVEKRLFEIMEKNKVDINKLEKINPKRLKKVILDAANEGIHTEEIVRTIKKKVGKKKVDSIIKKIDEAVNLTYEPPEGMFM